MSGDIVNLRQFRKRKKRQEQEKAAADNRIKFGRTKSRKLAEESERDNQSRKLDGHERLLRKEASETDE